MVEDSCNYKVLVSQSVLNATNYWTRSSLLCSSFQNMHHNENEILLFYDSTIWRISETKGKGN